METMIHAASRLGLFCSIYPGTSLKWVPKNSKTKETQKNIQTETSGATSII
jgi:hypothetical protein